MDPYRDVDNMTTTIGATVPAPRSKLVEEFRMQGFPEGLSKRLVGREIKHGYLKEQPAEIGNTYTITSKHRGGMTSKAKHFTIHETEPIPPYYVGGTVGEWQDIAYELELYKSKRTIRNYLQSLEEYGLIRRSDIYIQRIGELYLLEWGKAADALFIASYSDGLRVPASDRAEELFGAVVAP